MAKRITIETMLKYIFLFIPILCKSQLAEEWAVYPNYESYTNDMIMDKNANIFITGKIVIGQYSKILTIKYDSTGTQKWAAIHNNPANNTADYDIGIAIALDTLGNIFIAGMSSDSLNYSEICTIKYDSLGNEAWFKTLNGSPNMYNGGNDITVSGSGDVYVTGYVNGPASSQDAIILKYNSLGNLMWSDQINGLANLKDEGKTISLDSHQNVIITCNTSDSSVIIIPTLIAKYDSAGNSIWKRKYFGPFNKGAITTKMIVDAHDNIYAEGAVGTNGWQDLLLVKYDSSGNFMWESTYNGAYNNYELAHGLVLDSMGNAYISGDTECGPGCFNDIVTMKVDSSGNKIWAVTYNGSVSGQDYASDLAVDYSGHVYVSGRSDTTNFIESYVTIVYDTSGNYLGEVRDISPGGITRVIVKGENVFVSGNNYRNTNYNHITTIKYHPIPTSIQTNELSNSISIKIKPNPSNGRFYFAALEDLYQVNVINALGISLNYIYTESFIDLLNNPSGIYYAQFVFKNRSPVLSKLIRE